MARPRSKPLDPLIKSRIVPDTWVDINQVLGLGDKERGAGHTSHQMREAPEGAYFVWCAENTRYAQQLAKALNRPDLKVVAHYWLSTSEALYSPHKTPIVVDHAMKFS